MVSVVEIEALTDTESAGHAAICLRALPSRH